MAEGLIESIEHYRRVIAGLEEADLDGRDYESVYEGDPADLPEGMPTSFMVPWQKIPVVLPALRENLAFLEDLLTGLSQMAEGRGSRVRWRDVRGELDSGPGT